MPRTSRKKSISGFYHVIIRGVGRQLIFEDREDRYFFIKILEKYSLETAVTVVCYCLMENHVHILVCDHDEGLSRLMQKVCVSYSGYFNKKYDRTGHLFQNRFISENIEDARYLLIAFRYILNNPVKAGLGNADSYEWNSFNAYGDRTGFVDTAPVERYFASVEEYRRYIMAVNSDRCLEYDGYGHDDDWVEEQIRELLGIAQGMVLKDYTKQRRDRAIAVLRSAGLTIKQIERHTGISRGIIQRVKR